MTRDGESRRLQRALGLWAALTADNLAHTKVVGASAFSREACAYVLDSACIDLSPEEFERALVEFARAPFYGGNYLADAQRILKGAKG